MQNILVSHPGHEQLSAFALGKLDLSDVDAVENHLASCPACLETVHQIKEDTFLELVRECRTEADQPTEDRRDSAEAATVPPSNVSDSATVAPGEVSADSALLPGELLNHPRYRIVELLGRGGMGAVYKAEHRLMQRMVALKVINPQLVASKSAVERFRREVQAAARLHHPNIVTAHDAEQAGELHFLVMEYVNGTDLQRVVEDRGPLPVAQACDYIRQAALGLQNALENGMVHRDIKPHNLMLTSAEQVKILDFGLASLASEAALPADASTMDQQKSGLTQAGALMGTPDYMAPEQARDAHAADIRADIYSSGCTLYCLLTGKVPFAGGTAIDKVIAHSERKPPALREVRKDVPEALVKVLARMMAKDPADRYQTPAEVAVALAPLSVSGRGAGGRSRRRKLVALGAIAAGLLLAAAGIIFFWQTPNGTVRFEINDPAIKVTFDKDGPTITGADKKVITLRPGKHRMIVKHGDDLVFETTNFQMSRGGLTLLKIDWLGDKRVEVRQDGRWLGPGAPAHVLDAAQKAAEAWLKIFDEGKFAEAYEQSATVVKKTTPKDIVVRSYENAANQTGKLKDRAFHQRQHAVNPPGLPKGEYIVVTYAAGFEKLEPGQESVIVALEPDGQWRPIMYSRILWQQDEDDWRAALGRDPPPNPKIEVALKAAEPFLKLIDQADYARCWEEAAGLTRQFIGKADYVKLFSNLLKDRGQLKSRTVVYKRHTTTMGGGPPGDYVVIEYQSSFGAEANAFEIVTVALDQDGKWRVAMYESQPRAAQGELINTFGPGVRPITKEGVTHDDKSWKLDAKETRTFELYDIPPLAEDCIVTCSAQMKCAGLTGKAYLEMWCTFQGEKYFAKGLVRPLRGTRDWAVHALPFQFKKGEQPDNIRINVVVEGKGTVWIKDVELRKAPLPPGFGKSPPQPMPGTTVPKADEELLQGTWQAVAGEYAGRKLTADELKGARATFKDETLTLTLRMGDQTLRMTGPFSLDARKEPKRITFIIQQTPKDQKGAASNTGIHGIYRFDGDRLVLCITEGADRRPNEFTTSKQTPDQVLLNLQRVPKSP